MKKRLLSIILAFVLVFSFVSPALAADAYTPASEVLFTSSGGQGGTLDIETPIVVQDFSNDLVTEYPTLYISKDGALTLLRSFTADNCNYAIIYTSDWLGNVSPNQISISCIFSGEEYQAFDLTADYVLKIPAGIYVDKSGNPIGQQLISFSGKDIVNNVDQLTPLGMFLEQIHNYLQDKIPFFDYFMSVLDYIANFIFGY